MPTDQTPDSSTEAASQQIADQPGAEPAVEQNGLSAGGALALETPAGAPTEPSGKSQDNSGPSTIPLPELSEEVSTLAPLEPGTLVAERYEIIELLSSRPDSNIYRVADQQGYRRCWACGSTSSMQGDVYCVDCGAQLAGRHYRLQEFALPGEASGEVTLTVPLPQAILSNQVPGMAQVFDVLDDPQRGRLYVVWEEAYGRTLASWLEGDGATGTLPPGEEGGGRPSEEEALAVMAQAAEILATLHGLGLVGCDLSLNNLLVQPGDRLIMLDPSTCGSASADGQGGGEVSGISVVDDVRVLSAELERWYLAVRTDTSELPPSMLGSQTMGGEMVASLLSEADETTGPLETAPTTAVVLARAREGAYETAADFAAALTELYEESKPATNLQLWTGCATHVGRVRQINEDSLLASQHTILEHAGNTAAGLYVIADGMGGHQSGEIASSIAVRTIGQFVQSHLLGPLVAGDPVAHDPITCANLLRQAVLEANHRITTLARERHSDLGTTVTAALILGNQMAIANVGDSRVYHWRNGQLAPVTRDHSLVAQLVAAGELEPDDIYIHPRRNEIYRALGDPKLTENEVDLFTRRLQAGDGVLLCSDGLWDFVRNPMIAAIIEGQPDGDPQRTSLSLIDRANVGGGEDNISVIFVRVLSLKE